jgi:LmeA-like phospholipid-binding
VAYGEVEHYDRPRRRWGRRILITLIVLLALFAVLLAVADRVAANVAEQRIADEVQTQLTAREVQSTPPQVGVGGFPFLTQVLAENYEKISIEVRDVTAPSDQGAIRLPRLDVQAHDVKAPIETLRTGQGDIVASTVEGTATIGYASVVELIDQPNLRLAERDGKLLATLPVELFGQRFTLTGEATIEPVEGKIRLRFQDLNAEGLPTNDAVRSAVNGFARDLSVDVALPPLPFGIQVQEVRPLPEGLEVTATASDVPLNQAG